MVKRVLLALALASFTVIGCSAEASDGNDDEVEGDTGASESELRSAVSCSTERMDAYSGGSRIGTVDVIKVGGKRVTKPTGHAFLKWQKAAHAAGVNIGINSGFRTMDEQRYFYNCYQTGRCNNGNLAARPGYSNHQNGRAIDVSNSGSSWMQNNAARFGFRRTVSGEPWHFEYFGDDPGGPCSGGSSPAPDDASGDACQSATLGREVPERTCVQSRSDSQWYRCRDGNWFETTSSDSLCSARHPL
jgi:hypothetical protein